MLKGKLYMPVLRARNKNASEGWHKMIMVIKWAYIQKGG
jgi:hypothetical protein